MDATPDSVPAHAPRLSAHRAPAIRLPSDPLESAALVLRYVQTGSASFDRSAAVEAMTQRVARLSNPDADSASTLAELASHAAVLDALFQHWTCQAIAATVPDHKAVFARLALASQASYTRTLVAIEGLKQQGKGRGRVVLNDDSDSDSGAGLGSE